MKNRVIGGILIACISIPLLVLGGIYVRIFAGALALIGCYEFLTIRDKRFNIPLYIIMVAYIGILNFFNDLDVSITLLFIIGLFLFAICTPELSTDEISSVFLMGVVIGHGVLSVSKVYEVADWQVMFYLIMASAFTDVGAYLVGRKFGKHKLNERVSPNKTIEGAIGGYFFGAILSFIFAICMNFFGYPMHIFVILSLTLPIIAQIGDLAFSLIKRNYGAKDFGSLIPGHGGILDRVDSLLFCLIFTVSITSIIIL